MATATIYSSACMNADPRAAMECLDWDKKTKQELRKMDQSGTLPTEGINCYFEQMQESKKCLDKCEKGGSNADWKCSCRFFTPSTALTIVSGYCTLKWNSLLSQPKFA
ncbi:uncharacterized protein LOC142356446 isoform X2 [Convolutriloba macropyga]|uniref:uncharacterized protein LOC142356446 isoform X2 n=1 Tax=Convolutriloba macropyga TaxID=536237 RepID=UPI003F528A22